MDRFLQTYSDIQNLIFNADRIPDAILAIILSVIFELVMRYPVRPAIGYLWGGLFEWLGIKLDKPGRAKSDLIFRGFLLVFFAGQVFYFVGAAAHYGIRFFSQVDILQAVFLVFLMSSGALWRNSADILKSIKDPKSGVEGAYLQLAHITRTDLNATDHHGIARHCFMALVKTFDKTIIGTVFWYLIGGLPLAFLYSGLWFLTWRFNKQGLSKGFGVVAGFLEKIMGLIPALVSSLCLVLASISSPNAGIVRSVGSLFHIKNKATYNQGGLPLSVFSWALDISLGGPTKDLDGVALNLPWVGPEKASAKINPDLLRGGLFMIIIAHLIFIALLAGAYIAAKL